MVWICTPIKRDPGKGKPKSKSGERCIKPRRCACLALAALMAHCPATSAAGYVPDRKYFFDHCSKITNYAMAGEDRAVPRGTGQLTNDMRVAIGGLFDTWEAEGDTDPKRLAFILATARRESMGTWQPVREAPKCKEDEACRERVIGRLLADRAAKYNRALRPNYAQPALNGRRYYGRGYIQLTFESNYKHADRRLGNGTTLHDNPDRAMELATAQLILVRGMLAGWFGSHKPLSYYLDNNREDWIHARDNVNPGSDNKAITAESAKEILACIRPI
jgi:hypothetical protein